MKKQVKILITAGMIVTPTYLSSIIPISGSHAYAAVTEGKFETKEKAEADAFLKETKAKNEEWKKELSKEEKTVIEDIFQKPEQLLFINNELRESKGDPKKSIEKIEQINRALEKAPKTKEEKKIYVDVSSKSLSIDKKNIQKGNTIKEEGYTQGTLARDLNATSDVVIELTIPKGESLVNMTPTGSTTANYNELIEKSRLYEVTGTKEIKDGGLTRTKVEARLLSRNETLQKYNQELNADLEKSLNLLSMKDYDAEGKEKNQPLIQVDFTGHNMIHDYAVVQNIVESIKNIPSRYLDLLNEHSWMLLSETPPIQIIDTYLKDAPKAEASGIHYRDGEHKTIISLPASKDPIHTVLFEIGNAVSDLVLADSFSEREINQITQIFERERTNFPEDEPYSKNVQDYFAEYFSMLYSPNQEKVNKAKNEFPETYKFLDDKLKFINSLINITN